MASKVAAWPLETSAQNAAAANRLALHDLEARRIPCRTAPFEDSASIGLDQSRWPSLAQGEFARIEQPRCIAKLWVGIDWRQLLDCASRLAVSTVRNDPRNAKAAALWKRPKPSQAMNLPKRQNFMTVTSDEITLDEVERILI